jgi:hypothetical protein
VAILNLVLQDDRELGQAHPAVLARLRAVVAGLAALGLLALVLELWLIGHTESVTQIVPLVTLPAAAVALVAVVIGDARRGLGLLRAVLLTAVATGVAGVALHLYESWAFQLEIDPFAAPLARAVAALRAQSPPSLAPGQIALLALLGWASTVGIEAARPSSHSTKEHTS